MTIPKLRLLLDDARIKPAANEMKVHPHFQQTELVEYLRANAILAVGYCQLGSPNRPRRDRSPADSIDMQDPVVLEIALRHGIHPAGVCLKWAVQRGVVAIPMSTKLENYLANLEAVCGDPLDSEDINRIAAIDRNCRLVKGQVFLWKPGQRWEDLWDMDGEITPA
jgi:diketogulonate reductase-like aldo/keto reductase